MSRVNAYASDHGRFPLTEAQYHAAVRILAAFMRHGVLPRSQPRGSLTLLFLRGDPACR